MTISYQLVNTWSNLAHDWLSNVLLRNWRYCADSGSKLSGYTISRYCIINCDDNNLLNFYTVRESRDKVSMIIYVNDDHRCSRLSQIQNYLYCTRFPTMFREVICVIHMNRYPRFLQRDAQSITPPSYLLPMVYPVIFSAQIKDKFAPHPSYDLKENLVH